jgi:hypothetical protein
VETVESADFTDRLVAASHKPAATSAFEFLRWMASWIRGSAKLSFID